MGERVITIPYHPRPPQPEIHKGLESHRWSVIVAHRRMGKTVCVLNHLLKKALLDESQTARYAYIAPYRNQAKAIAWDYLKRFSGVVPGVRFSEGDLEVFLPNGSRIRLYGADNPDALRGIYLDGVVMDEVADMKPEVWSEIVRPALSDRMGWAVFIGTPKGQNLFYELYEQASKDGWFRGIYRADETNVLPEEELEDARSVMSDNQFRQEFLCDFTASVDNVLITIDMVSRAAKRTITESDVLGAPVILGVDVARFGDDRSVICRRKGLNCFPLKVIDDINNMDLAGMVAQEIMAHEPDAVFIDMGRGEGVIDRLRQLGFCVTEVNFGGKASKPGRYVNKRSEMWDGIRQWLDAGGGLPNDPQLKGELATPTYSFDAAGKMLLEPKDKIKERGFRSPDLADALALTFAYSVAAKNSRMRPNTARATMPKRTIRR